MASQAYCALKYLRQPMATVHVCECVVLLNLCLHGVSTVMSNMHTGLAGGTDDQAFQDAVGSSAMHMHVPSSQVQRHT